MTDSVSISSRIDKKIKKWADENCISMRQLIEKGYVSFRENELEYWLGELTVSQQRVIQCNTNLMKFDKNVIQCNTEIKAKAERYVNDGRSIDNPSRQDKS